MKKLLALLLAMIMVFSLMACAASDDAPAADASADDTPAADASADDTPAADAPSDDTPAADAEEAEPVEISWMFSVAEEGRKQWAQWVADKTMELYPYITVTIDFGSNATHDTNLQTRVASGDAPNIFDLSRTDTIQYAEAGHIADISDLPGLENMTGAVANGNIDGVQYTLPCDQNAFGIFYNKAIFDELGLEVPTTHSEFLAVCKTIKDNGITPLATPFGEGWCLRNWLTHYMNQLIIADDAGWYTKKMNLENSFSDDELYKYACEQMWSTHEYWMEDAFGTSYDDACNAFCSGKAAMILDASWILGTLSSINADMDVRVFATPVSDEQAPKICVSAGNGFAAYNDVEDPAKTEAAKTLLSVMASKESAEVFATVGQGMPTYNVDVDMAPALKDCMSYTGDQYFTSAGIISFSAEYAQIWLDNVAISYNTDTFDVEEHCANLDAEFATVQ